MSDVAKLQTEVMALVPLAPLNPLEYTEQNWTDAYMECGVSIMEVERRINDMRDSLVQLTAFDIKIHRLYHKLIELKVLRARVEGKANK